MDALPAHIDRLLACMAQPPSAAHQPLAVPLDPSQLIPLLDHPLLQRWLAALACQQRHGTGVAREKPKASTPEPSVAALFDAFDLQQVELYIYSDACSNHPRAINATRHQRHALARQPPRQHRRPRRPHPRRPDRPAARPHLPRHAVPTSACTTPPPCWPASTRPSGSRWRSSRRGARSCSPCRARCCGCWHRRAPAVRRPCHGARDLEHLLTRMVARNDAGLPPIPLAAEPAPRRD